MQRLALLAVAPFIGSFLGVLIRRLPAGTDWVTGRSACASCGHRLGPLDLVPLVSYAVLRGRCRHCRAPIGAFHPAIELAALTVVAWAISAGDTGLGLLDDCLLGWLLLALAWIDAETLYLFDLLTLPLMVLGLADAALLAPWALADRALAALIGWFGLLAAGLLYRRLRRRDGIGGGDAKLLGAAGAWLGLAALPWVLLGGGVLGLAWAGVLRLGGARLNRASVLPFGPPLAVAIWLLRLYGDRLGL